MTGVRTAAESDILALCDLYLEFHEFHAERIPERLCSLAPMWSAEMAGLKGRLREIMAGGDADILVAEADGTISGFAEIYLREDQGTSARPAARYCHLQSMFVTADRRRSGIGRLLLAASESWARTRGAKEIRLDVWEFDEGPSRFYEKHGYRPYRRSYVRSLR
ncbi:MAG: GNAT family N-acetyltransferase [Candidatus Eisenbacteria bacterium]|nr:GNAT family N-acetyltransferase [Candidatus Eisenbacteria bacterium]